VARGKIAGMNLKATIVVIAIVVVAAVIEFLLRRKIKP